MVDAEAELGMISWLDHGWIFENCSKVVLKFDRKKARNIRNSSTTGVFFFFFQVALSDEWKRLSVATQKVYQEIRAHDAAIAGQMRQVGPYRTRL